MSTSKRYLVVLLTLVVASAAALGFYSYYKSTHTLSDSAQVRIVVANFGDELRFVSLLAPAQNVANAMDQHYAFYVHPDLLAKWKADPSTALGRLTSSPYPDRIDITGSQKNDDGTYYVLGNIVEVANTVVGTTTARTAVNSIPVRFVLKQGGDGFQIVDYQKL
jgi:hypothetical protein